MNASQATVCALAAAAPAAALAHAGESAPGLAFDFVLFATLATLAAVYCLGVRARSMRSHGRLRDLSAGCTLLALAVALIGPLDAQASVSLSAHMAQHMLLTVVAAPLWAAARPGTTLTRGLPDAAARAIGSMRAAPAVRSVSAVLRSPSVTGVLHGIALWFWHLPAAYTAALESEALHAFEHVTLFGTGLLFWRAVLLARTPALGRALMWLLLTLMHTGLLGALLALAPHPLYVLHGGPAALADQQLAGLVMWVPMGTVYLLAGQWLARRLLHESGRAVPMTPAAQSQHATRNAASRGAPGIAPGVNRP